MSALARALLLEQPIIFQWSRLAVMYKQRTAKMFPGEMILPSDTVINGDRITQVGFPHQSLAASLFTSVTSLSKRCWIAPPVESYLWTPGSVLLRPPGCHCPTYRWLLLCFPISLLIHIYVIEQRKSLHDTKVPFASSRCCLFAHTAALSYLPVFLFCALNVKWEIKLLLTSTWTPWSVIVLQDLTGIMLPYCLHFCLHPTIIIWIFKRIFFL